MRYAAFMAVVVGVLGFGFFIPQRELVNTSGQEAPFVVRVPQEYPTIQAAIDAVAEGGMVLIGPGTYQESIRITKSLRVIGVSQDLVHIQANKAITIEAVRPIQVYLSDLTVKAQQLGIGIGSQVQAIIERSTVTSRYVGIELLGGSVGFLSAVTISRASCCGIFTLSSHLGLQGATIKENHIGIALVLDAILTVQDSIMKENDIGIAAIIGLGGRGILDIFDNSLSANMLAAVAVINNGLLEAYLARNEISTNGVGIYLGYDFYQENQQKFQRPIPRLVRMSQNKIIGNLYYGLALQRKECDEDRILSKILQGLFPLPIPILGVEEASLEGTVFTGWDNKIQDNGKADLCPPDYPWPPGFRK